MKFITIFTVAAKKQKEARSVDLALCFLVSISVQTVCSVPFCLLLSQVLSQVLSVEWIQPERSDS